MGTQVGLRKHHYKQNYWRWWNSSWTISNPKRWSCESAALNMSANLKKHRSGYRTGKGQFSFQSQRKTMPKNVQTIRQLYSSHPSKVRLKILQARLQQYINHELPDVQAGFRKGRGTRDQIANTHWRIPENHLLLPYWLRLWLCRSQQTGKFSKRWEY